MPDACAGVLGGSGSCGCGARDMSLSRYHVPMPNTAKYTMTNAMSDVATAGAASGDAESAVRIRP